MPSAGRVPGPKQPDLARSDLDDGPAGPVIERSERWDRTSLVGLTAASSAESLRLDECCVEAPELPGAQLHVAVTDCEIVRGDLSNLRLHEKSIVRRTRVTGSRLTGVQWRGVLHHVTFESCALDLAAFRACELNDVTFDGCRMVEADFYEARLRRVRLLRCDLTGADFSKASCAESELADCELAGLTGVANLRGFAVGHTDLLELAAPLAHALGIEVLATDERSSVA